MLKYTLVALALALLALGAPGCSSGDSAATTQDTDTSPADTAAAGADVADPVIDESTLLPDSLRSERSYDLALPPRRFYSLDAVEDFMASSPHAQEYAQGILPRMARENLAWADRLLNNPCDYFIVADKQAMHVILYDRYGRLVRSYPMACARNYGTKHRKSDNRTPEGFFFAQGVYDSTDWLYTDDNGHTHPQKGVYGPRFIRIKADVTASIGIHGTGSPGSIGRRVSHGCIRLSNASIVDLVKYVHPGMPIIVNPSDRDAAVNRSEGYDVGQITTGLTPSALSKDVSAEVNPDYVARPVVVPDTVAAAPADSVGLHPEAADSVSRQAPEPPAVPDSI